MKSETCDCYGCYFKGQGTCGCFECRECGVKQETKLPSDEGRYLPCDACRKEEE